MDWQPLAQFLDDTAVQLRIPAAFCTVRREHELLFAHACGVSRTAIRESRNGLFWVYSATKPVCAAAAMQMIEAGIFRPDDPVARYLPEYGDLRVQSAPGVSAPAAQPLRIRHLLTMQGGFDYELRPPAVEALLKKTRGAADTRSIAAAFAEKPLQFVPGSHFAYSLCMDILGAAMEAASGVRLGRWLQEKIFSPLGMADTGFSQKENAPAPAPQYRLRPDGCVERIGNENFCRLTPLYESGGGGLCSTIADYGRFADAMACGGEPESGARILAARSVDQMRQNRLQGESLQDFRRRYTRPGYGYGCGVRVSTGTAQPGGVFGWDGAGGVHVLMDPDRKLSLVYFQQVLDMEILYDHVFDKMDALLYSTVDQAK